MSIHPTLPRWALASIATILFCHIPPAHAQGCGGDVDGPAWGAEGEVESVRRIGEVDGRVLYAEVRRQDGGFSYSHRVMLIRTDTLPFAGCFVVGDDLRTVDSDYQPLEVPTVVQVIFHGLTLGPVRLVAEVDGGRTILVERYTAGWRQDDAYTTERWDWDGGRYRPRAP